MRRMLLAAALLGVACGIPIGTKRQQAERKLKSLVSRMLQDEEPRPSDLHEGRMPGADDDEDRGAGVCPSYVSLTGNEGGRLQVDDEYCDKNCRMGFCPTDKCRCSTDEAAEAENRHGLIGTAEDACPKYVTLAEGDGSKSTFGQVDDDWCDSNCRGNFLSCPKDKCRCFTDTQALKDFLAQAAEATRAEEDDLVGDDATLASARAADRAAIHSQPGVGATEEEEELAGNCPKFVSLKARNGVGGAIKSFATTDEVP